MALLSYAAKFDPVLSLDCDGMEGSERNKVLPSGNLVSNDIVLWPRKHSWDANFDPGQRRPRGGLVLAVFEVVREEDQLEVEEEKG